MNEWTHLTDFVTVDQKNSIGVFSIGTRTKCLGEEKDEHSCLLQW